jgi:hypothetical protein
MLFGLIIWLIVSAFVMATKEVTRKTDLILSIGLLFLLILPLSLLL